MPNMPGLHGAQMVVTFNKLYPANSGITGFEICLLYFSWFKETGFTIYYMF